jgi:hypothetical protein
MGSERLYSTHLVPTWFLLGSSDSPRSCLDCSASAGRHGAQRRSQSASVPACLSFSEKRKTYVILPSMGVKSQLWEAKLHGFLSWNF